MPQELDIHVATEQEQIEAFDNLHDVWSGGRSREEHLKYRVESPKHQNATWYVGTLDGQVVVGLGCYRFEYRIGDSIEPGYAFGEVHTKPEHRGKGFAPLLIAWVEEHQKSQGRSVGMLYSDINPDYYARLGYLHCPANEGWADPRSAGSNVSQACRLVPLSPADELDAMAAMYEGSHAARAVSVARSSGYWKYLIRRDPQNEYFRGVDGDGKTLGYVRLACSPQEIKLRDLALVSQEDATRRSVLLALLQLGKERGVERVGGWMADTPLHREMFEVRPRTRELTMLKSLRSDLTLEPALLADVDHFQEMDHV